MNEKWKIAFIGPQEYCNAMRFAGFECFKVMDENEAVELIEKIENEDYALIFVSQDVAPRDVGLDKVVVLPGMAQASDQDYLKNEIKKAIGGEMNLSVK